MPWWGWIIVGALLLGAEMTFVDLELYLVFLGISALVVGSLGVVGVELPVWGQWLAFAALAILTMVTLRGRLYRRIHRDTPDFEEPLVGATLALPQDLAPGQSCRAELRGSQWTVHNAGSRTLTAGTSVRVGEVQGLTLTVGSNDPA